MRTITATGDVVNTAVRVFTCVWCVYCLLLLALGFFFRSYHNSRKIVLFTAINNFLSLFVFFGTYLFSVCFFYCCFLFFICYFVRLVFSDAVSSFSHYVNLLFLLFITAVYLEEKMMKKKNNSPPHLLNIRNEYKTYYFQCNLIARFSWYDDFDSPCPFTFDSCNLRIKMFCTVFFFIRWRIFVY